MSGCIVMATFGDGLPRGIQIILLRYDTALPHRRARCSATGQVGKPACPDHAQTGSWTARIVRRKINFSFADRSLATDDQTAFTPNRPVQTAEHLSASGQNDTSETMRLL